MISFPAEVIMEILVALLLAATLVYCWLLDRRLKAIRSGQGAMRKLVTSLNAATEQARESIGELRDVSTQSADELDQRLQKARALADELSLILESGNHLVTRIEKSRAPYVKPVSRPEKNYREIPEQEPDDVEKKLFQILQKAR